MIATKNSFKLSGGIPLFRNKKQDKLKTLPRQFKKNKGTFFSS